MVESSAVLISGMDGMGWDLCVGLLYEHRFAVLITQEQKQYFDSDLKQ